MALTFLDLKTKVLGWLDEADDSGTVLTNVEEALNAAHAARLGEREWPFLLSAPTTLTLVPGTRSYALDATYDRPLYFYNVTKRCPLRIVPLKHVNLAEPIWLTEGQQNDAVLEGQTLRLLWTPDSADEIEYQFYQQPVDMTADGDLPQIPFPYSRILVWDALLALSAYSDDLSPTKYQVWERNQQQAELGLLGAYMDAQTLGALGEYVNLPTDLL